MARDSPINAHHNISTKTRGNTVPRPFFFFFFIKTASAKNYLITLTIVFIQDKAKTQHRGTEKPVGKTCSLTS